MKKIFNIFLGISTLIFCLSIFNTASALNVVFSEDRPDLRTLDPRITQSRHEEMIIVQMFDQLISPNVPFFNTIFVQKGSGGEKMKYQHFLWIDDFGDKLPFPVNDLSGACWTLDFAIV